MRTDAEDLIYKSMREMIMSGRVADKFEIAAGIFEKNGEMSTEVISVFIARDEAVNVVEKALNGFFKTVKQKLEEN